MDEYVDAALRMQERCAAPRRTLVGNWVHAYPDDANPGPNLDWHHELVRFFDHWLKGVDNGVMDEPAVVLFRHDEIRPEPFPVAWPGEWLAFDAWPPPGIAERVLHLAPGAAAARRRARATPRPARAGGRAVRPSSDGRDAGGAVVGRRLRARTAWPGIRGPTRR